jgi:flagellar L-ring protein precursor FlgH
MVLLQMRWLGSIFTAALVATSAAASVAWGQSSSLFGDPADRSPLTLPRYSWTYQAPAEPREVRLNDLITVIVDEKTRVISEGEVDRRKRANLQMILKDWIILDGWAVRPDPQSTGDPTIAGSVESKYRANADLDTRDTMQFRISCRVVDLRPNGNLVLEGHRTIRNNHEVWEMSLSGEVEPDALMPNDTVHSEDVADLRIYKRESGHVRDGYRRGWLLRWMDAYQPF